MYDIYLVYDQDYEQIDFKGYFTSESKAKGYSEVNGWAYEKLTELQFDVNDLSDKTRVMVNFTDDLTVYLDTFYPILRGILNTDKANLNKAPELSIMEFGARLEAVVTKGKEKEEAKYIAEQLLIRHGTSIKKEREKGFEEYHKRMKDLKDAQGRGISFTINYSQQTFAKLTI